jgi:hypothetical protein
MNEKHLHKVRYRNDGDDFHELWASRRILRLIDPLELPAFRVLKDEAFFRNVRPDDHGYGVVWSDDVDLAESELWLKGITEQAA